MDSDFLSLLPILSSKIFFLIPQIIVCVAAFIYSRKSSGILGGVLLFSSFFMVIIFLANTVLFLSVFTRENPARELYNILAPGIAVVSGINQIIFAGALLMVMINWKQQA
jgi:hypothetical protein